MHFNAMLTGRLSMMGRWMFYAKSLWAHRKRMGIKEKEEEDHGSI